MVGFLLSHDGSMTCFCGYTSTQACSILKDMF